MNKKILLLTTLLLSIFIGINNVGALEFDESTINDAIEKEFTNDNYALMCGYNITIDGDIYTTALALNRNDSSILVVQEKASGRKFKFKELNDKKGTNENYISTEARSKLINEGQCPTYAYQDKSGWFMENAKVCFDNDGKYCDSLSDNYEADQNELVYNFSKDDVDTYESFVSDGGENWLGKCYYESADSGNVYSVFFNNNAFVLKQNGIVVQEKNLSVTNCDVKTVFDDIDVILNFGLSSTGRFASSEYDAININNSFLDTYLGWYETAWECPQNLVVSEYYENLPGDCKNLVYRTRTDYCVGENCSCKSMFKKCDQAVLSSTQESELKPLPSKPVIPGDDVDVCELFGEDLIDTINSFLQYIKIIVPILIIGFGIVDFAQAVLSSDESGMKKAQKRFIIRLVVGVAIFFVPSIVTLILEIANGIWANINPNSCNIG